MALADTLKTDLNAPLRPSQQFEKETIAPLREKMMTSLESEASVGRQKEMQQASSAANLSASMATYDTQAAEKLHNDPNLMKYQEAIDQKSKAAYIPDQENPERLATVLAITNLLGIAIGGKGKNSAQTALAAQNGMLEGYQKGRADIIKQQKDVFDENQKALDKSIENLHRGFQDALALAPRDRQAAEQKAMSTINQENADFLRELYNKTGLVGASKTVAELLKQAESRQKLMQQEEMKMIRTPHELEMERQGRERLSKEGQSTYDYYVGKDGKTYALNKKNPKDVQEVTGVNFAGATKVGAKEPAEKSLKKGEYQAKFVSDIIGEPIDVDTASKAVAGTQYKQKLKDLQEMNSTLGGVPGLKVDFADYINKAIATKAGPDGKFSKEDLDAAYEQLKTDPKLSKSFSALSDDSKVMAKAELDAVMQNLQTKYGNRAPVAEFRATQSVLSRKNMSASSYNRVLANEIQATDDRLKGLGMKPTAVIALERHFAKHPNEVSLMQSIPEESNQSQDNVGL